MVGVYCWSWCLSIFTEGAGDYVTNDVQRATGYPARSYDTCAIQWWHLIISAMGSGLGMALAMGARQSIISEMVARDELLNAVALFNLATTWRE